MSRLQIYLVAGLVDLLGVEGGTETKGETRVDLGVVGDRSNAAVVDLALYRKLALVSKLTTM